MLFPASVANGMSPRCRRQHGSSFGSYGPRSLYNIKWNGKVSGFLDLIAARAGVSWRYNPTEKRVEFYYLDTRTFRIYAFDDVNTVDSTVRSGMTTAAGISGMAPDPLDRMAAPASAATPAASRPPAPS